MIQLVLHFSKLVIWGSCWGRGVPMSLAIRYLAKFGFVAEGDASWGPCQIFAKRVKVLLLAFICC